MSKKEIQDEVSRRVAEAREQIALKIGSALHDVAVQRAFMCSMDFHTLKRLIKDRETRSVLRRLEANVKHMTKAMRAASHGLSPSDNKKR